MPTQTVKVPLGPWLPDLANFDNPGLTEAKNIVPTAAGEYAPFESLSQIETGSLSATCVGAAAFRDSDGNAVVFAAQGDKLVQLSSGSFTDVSNTSLTYTVATSSYVQFAQYGQRIVAANRGFDTQKLDLGSDNAFSTLAGSPPRAKCLAGVRDFLVMGDVIDPIDGDKRSRVAWSGFNNSEIWGLDVANQADSQDLAAEYGRVQAIVGREYGTIFQETAITRMTYVGPPVVFQFDVLETARGAFAPYSVVAVGRTIFYLAQDGFYALNGAESTPIGRNQVDRWVIDQIDFTSRDQVLGVADLARGIVMWGFPSIPASAIDSLVIYSWRTGSWTRVDLGVEYMFQSADRGYTLEELDVFGSVDDLPYSLDSDHWKGGKVALAAFDASHKYCSFTGPSLEAIVETGEFETAPGLRAFVSGARVLTDATPVDSDPADSFLLDSNGNTIRDSSGDPIGDSTLMNPWGVAIGSRSQFLGSEKDWSLLSRPGSGGSVPVRKSGRFMAARIVIPDGTPWSYLKNLELMYRAAGRR